jgi:2,4-dienoyl-CoA reductase-like NADH-dependent reductase (Old Yellow Enzyme family)/thioredoxin reductase
MNNYPHLFSPITINNLTIKNRGVMPPMVTNYALEDGTVNQRVIDYYGARADGGVGLIIMEAVCVSPEGRGFPNMINIYSDDYIPGLKKLVDRVHQGGAKIAAQILHCGRQANPIVTGQELVAPSPIPCPVMQSMPHELTVDEIKVIITKFADAARRALEAGFDMVELHGAHGYLINQFLSPFTNQRTDEYGGSPENRERFPLEVLAAVREKVGSDYPVIYRISSEEFLEDGLQIADTAAFCKKLVDNGIDGIDVSGGTYSSGHSVSGTEDKMGFYIENSAAIKNAINNRVPVIVANRIRTPQFSEEIISNGKADMIGTGRTLLCDSEFYNKAKEGRTDEIRKCTSCLYCISLLLGSQSAKCLYNPLLGCEGKYDLTEKAILPKKVVVIGGGPAGMEAAYVAAKRGHHVTLFEKSGALGGNVIPGTKPPLKDEISFVVEYLSRMVENPNIDVKLSTKASIEDVKELSPDIVLIATGSAPIIPDIDGIGLSNVVTAEDVLMNKVPVGKNVVIIGGGSVGVETGEFVAHKGSNVTVIEMENEILTDILPGMKGTLLARAQTNLNIKLSETVVEIKENAVVTDKGTYDNIETVVLAVGYQSVDEMSDELSKSGYDVRIIGDANSPRKINDAVDEGFIAAYEL